MNNPSLYPHDPFAIALSRYPSVMWPFVAWMARLLPLEPLLLGLFLLERLLSIYAAGKLARSFAGGSQLAAIGVMALFAFAITPLLGNGTIVDPYFEQTGMAVAAFLLAGAAFHDSRPAAWALASAIGFNLNGMYGAFAMSYFAGVFVFDRTYRGAWRKWGGPSFCFSRWPLTRSFAAYRR